MGHINLQKCRIFFYMYIYTFQHANIFIRACFSLLDPDGKHLTYVYTYIHIYMSYIYTYICKRVVCVCNHTPLLTRSDVCVYVCMCVCVYVCMCVCVYVCMCVKQDLNRSIATSEFWYIKSHTPITYIYKKVRYVYLIIRLNRSTEISERFW